MDHHLEAVERHALAREVNALEGDGRAVLHELVVREGHVSRPHKRGEDALERAAVEAAFAEEIAMELPDCATVADAEGLEDPYRGRDLRGGGRAKGRRLGGAGRADVAQSARRAGVLLIAEMSDQLEHPARRRLGVAAHLAQLLALVRALPVVAAPPVGGAPRDDLVRAEHRAAVQPELLERLVEQVGAHARTRRQLGRGDPVGAYRLVDLREDLRRRVVAIEEELVRLGVHERVEEHGAGRCAVAAGATDLLIVALERRGERGVEHRANVRLVDAHPERGRRDDDVERALEESRLHVVADVGGEARVIRGGAYALLGERLGQRVRFFSRRRVDDRRARVRIGEEATHDLGALARVLRGDLDADVGPAETVNEARR